MRPVAEQAAPGFGGLLRQLRADAGLTQEELAEAASLSPRSVSDLERGINLTARKDTARLLAGALGLAGPQRALFEAAARGRAAAAGVLAAHDPLLTRPGNLPAQLSAFIGRDRELAEVRALVESARLVTLTGPAGAARPGWACRWPPGCWTGPGTGCGWRSWPRSPTRTRWRRPSAQALRLAAQPGRPALEALLDALAPQDVLIVLDNCEHLIGGCAKTAEAIVRRCPRVHLLATSREPLGIGGETIYRVPSLSLPGPGEAGPPGARVLRCGRAVRGPGPGQRRRPGRGRADRPGGGVGVPAAGRDAAGDRAGRGPAAVDVAGRAARPAGSAVPAADRGQPHRAGTPADAAGDRRLVLFAADRRRAGAAGAACRCSPAASAWTRPRRCAGPAASTCWMSRICSGRWWTRAWSWPSPPGQPCGTGCWRRSGCSPPSGSSRPATSEAAAVAAAHCAHFLAVAETAAAYLTGPEQGSWLARLDADQANLRRAAGHAAGRPDGTAVVLRLGVALDRYWRARSRQQEAFGLLVPALRRPDARADPALFAAALVTAALVACFIDVATARQLAEQAVQVARQLGDERLLSRALAALCGAHFFAGEPETGRPFGQESVERARRLGDDVLLARSLLGYLMTIDPARSGPLYAEAIACTERSGDHLTNSILHDNASVAALEAGDLPAARAHLEAAAQAAQQIGWENAIVPADLGYVLRAEGDLDGARSAFEASPADRPPERRQLEHGRRHPRPGLPGRRCGRLGPGSRAARRRAGLSGPDRQSVARIEARDRRDSLDQARAHLGDEQLERAYAQGMALSLDKALDLALPKAGPA